MAHSKFGDELQGLPAGVLNELRQFWDSLFDQGVDVVKVAEDLALQRFTSRAHHYLTTNLLPTTKLEWFAMMQHYGAPTRLLDFTRSPYIAAYFAVEDAATSCAVWAVDGAWCDLKGLEGLKRHAGTDNLFSPRSPQGFDAIVTKGIDGVFSVTPEHLNERLTIQQGLFLALGNSKKTFEENLMAYDDGALKHRIYRFLIPVELRSQMLYDLNRMNISRATLFPGLDGFAQSVRYELFYQGDQHFANAQLGLVDKAGEPYFQNLVNLFETSFPPEMKAKLEAALESAFSRYLPPGEEKDTAES